MSKFIEKEVSKFIGEEVSKLEKILAIVNPVSNNGKTEDNWSNYSKIFINSGLNIEERFSKYPLHASEIAREAVNNGYSYIMVVGGVEQ